MQDDHEGKPPTAPVPQPYVRARSSKKAQIFTDAAMNAKGL